MGTRIGRFGAIAQRVLSPPTDPSSVTLSDISLSDNMQVIVNGGTGQDEFRLEYNENSGSYSALAVDTDGNYVFNGTILGLGDGNTIRVRARGENAAGNSNWVISNAVIFNADGPG